MNKKTIFSFAIIGFIFSLSEEIWCSQHDVSKNNILKNNRKYNYENPEFNNLKTDFLYLDAAAREYLNENSENILNNLKINSLPLPPIVGTYSNSNPYSSWNFNSNTYLRNTNLLTSKLNEKTKEKQVNLDNSNTNFSKTQKEIIEKTKEKQENSIIDFYEKWPEKETDKKLVFDMVEKTKEKIEHAINLYRTTKKRFHLDDAEKFNEEYYRLTNDEECYQKTYNYISKCKIKFNPNCWERCFGCFKGSFDFLGGSKITEEVGKDVSKSVSNKLLTMATATATAIALSNKNTSHDNVSINNTFHSQTNSTRNTSNQ